jgi:hypothetical protein
MYSSTHNQALPISTLTLEGEGGGCQRYAPATLPQGKRSSTHCTGSWVGLGPVWLSQEYLAPTRVQTLDHPAHSDCLYKLCYPGCRVVKFRKPKHQICLIQNISVIGITPTTHIYYENESPGILWSSNCQLKLILYNSVSKSIT